MKYDLDILAVAIQLVRELGDDAPIVSRNRVVELTAVDNRRAAQYWRSVMHACEELLAERAPVAEMPPQTVHSSADHPTLH